LTEKQTFDRTAARDALTEEPRGKDPGVVQDKQIARAKVVGQPYEIGMFDVLAIAV
jgi:hypothetical protein